MTRDETNTMISEYMQTTDRVKYYCNGWDGIMDVVQKLAKDLKGKRQLRILPHVVLYGTVFQVFEICGALIEFNIVNKKVTKP